MIVCLLSITSAEVFSQDLDVSAVTNAQTVVEYLDQYPYPTNESIVVEGQLSFSQRDSVIVAILQKDFLLAETNALFDVADYLALGEPFSVSNRAEAIRKAHLHDNFLELGTSNTVRRSGLIYHSSAPADKKTNSRLLQGRKAQK